MGTRTYSRRGVLTAAGRRRAGLEAINIFGETIPDAEPPKPTATSELADFQKSWRDRINAEIAANPKTELSDASWVASNDLQIFKDTVYAVQALDDAQLKQLLEEQRAREPNSKSAKILKKSRNPVLLFAIAKYAVNPEDREAAIQLINDTYGEIKQYEKYYWGLVRNDLASNSFDYQAMLLADYPDEFKNWFWNMWSRHPASFGQYGFSSMHEALKYVGPNKEIKAPSDFWPENIVPPRPNPKVIQLLEEQYQETQKKLIDIGMTEEGIILGRGTSQIRGLSMESWSPDPASVKRFAEFGGVLLGQRPFPGSPPRGEERWGVVPRKYIMGSYRTIPFWDESGQNAKQEYMVLASSYYAQEKGKSVETRPRVKGKQQQSGVFSAEL